MKIIIYICFQITKHTSQTHKSMANSSKSNALMDYNALVLDKLEEKLGLSRYYIKQCINGRRNCVTGDTVRKEYHRLCAQVNAALNQ